jgi:hypothetical protein
MIQVNCGSGYDSCSVVCCAALSNDSGYKPPEKPSYKPPVYEKPSYKPPVVYEKPSYKPPSYEPLAYPAENPVYTAKSFVLWHSRPIVNVDNHDLSTRDNSAVTDTKT